VARRYPVLISFSNVFFEILKISIYVHLLHIPTHYFGCKHGTGWCNVSAIDLCSKVMGLILGWDNGCLD
jgi:hypothetical protein